MNWDGSFASSARCARRARSPSSTAPSCVVVASTSPPPGYHLQTQPPRSQWRALSTVLPARADALSGVAAASCTPSRREDGGVASASTPHRIQPQHCGHARDLLHLYALRSCYGNKITAVPERVASRSSRSPPWCCHAIAVFKSTTRRTLHCREGRLCVVVPFRKRCDFIAPSSPRTQQRRRSTGDLFACAVFPRSLRLSALQTRYPPLISLE